MSAFDGLSLDLLAGNRTEDEAVTALHYHLDRIFNDTPVTATFPDPSALQPEPA